jgi:hypothetical protein
MKTHTTREQTLQTIINAVRENKLAGKYSFDGLDSSEIGAYHRYLMFGANDEAFPSQEEWAAIVD